MTMTCEEIEELQSLRSKSSALLGDDFYIEDDPDSKTGCQIVQATVDGSFWAGVAEMVYPEDAAVMVPLFKSLPEILELALFAATLRPEVKAFAERMEAALKAHDADYGGNSWKKDTPEELLEWVKKHYVKMARYARDATLARRKDDEIEEGMALDDCAKNAVHLANYAMMLCDVCAPLSHLPPESEVG